MLLTLDDLPSALNLKAHKVDVPEFGQDFEAFVAELSADERDERLEIPWIKHREDTGDESNAGFRAFAVAACWCDAERKFTASTVADIKTAAKKLGACDSRPVTRMFVKAAELNGLTADSHEDAEKN